MFQEIKFLPHALKRMKERGIKQEDVEKFIRNPDKIEISKINRNRFLIKKIYYNKIYRKDHLIMIIGEREDNSFKIITIIDTSKISKYI